MGRLSSSAHFQSATWHFVALIEISAKTKMTRLFCHGTLAAADATPGKIRRTPW